MDLGQFQEHIRKLDLQPNSVLFINVEQVNVYELTHLRMPDIGYTVPIIFTLGPPQVNQLSREDLERALQMLDNDQGRAEVPAKKPARAK